MYLNCGNMEQAMGTMNVKVMPQMSVCKVAEKIRPL